MLQLTCLQKIRDKNGFIRGYRLKDMNGEIRDIRPDALKNAIALQKCVVDNLTLTSDWRLIDKSEKFEINWN